MGLLKAGQRSGGGGRGGEKGAQGVFSGGGKVMKALDEWWRWPARRSHRGGTKGQLNFRWRQDEMDVAAGWREGWAGCCGGGHGLAKRH